MTGCYRETMLNSHFMSFPTYLTPTEISQGHVTSSGECTIRRDMSHLGQNYDRGVCGCEFSPFYDVPSI